MHISKFLLACTLLAGLPALAAPAASIIAFTDPPPRPSPPRTPQEPVRKPKGRRK